MRKLSNLERELFEIHKRQKMRLNAWQNKTVAQVQVNYDFLDTEAQTRMKRFKTAAD